MATTVTMQATSAAWAGLTIYFSDGSTAIVPSNLQVQVPVGPGNMDVTALQRQKFTFV
jgi:hypothetical protein